MNLRKKSGIYLIQSKKDSRKNVGSAADLYTRFHSHKLHLLRGDHCNQKLQRFVNKYGFESLSFSVIECCEKSDLIKIEQHWIDSLKPQFNIARIAGNTLGVKHTPESLLKMSSVRKGKQTTGMLGKQHSEETKKMISEKCKARGLHPNFIKASIQANTGRKKTDDEIRRRSLTQSKLSIMQIREIWGLRNEGKFQKEIAIQFNVSQRVICRVLNRIGIYEHLYELDKDYFDAQEKRFQAHIKQPKLFDVPKIEHRQEVLF